MNEMVNMHLTGAFSRPFCKPLFLYGCECLSVIYHMFIVASTHGVYAVIYWKLERHSVERIPPPA